MTPEVVIDVFSHSIQITIVLLLVIIVPGLAVGLIIAMFQAATQVNEMSLNFLPKMLITLLVIVAAGPWMLHLLVEYTQELINEIPYIVG
ncbi:MAG: flagellar biosynthesis protein FliQ [Gammaproteobacteria bacterium]